MKPFYFSLEKVRDYQDQLLNKEKSVLVTLKQQQKNLENEIKSLYIYIAKKRSVLDIKQREGITMAEICSMQLIIDAACEQVKEAEIRLKAAKQAVEKQLEAVIDISRKISGLDKLKEKKFEEHKYLQGKEDQQQILELLTTKISYNS